jgi:biopolymer transport protein ExbD
VSRKKREAITPELTPLIDVVFLLLIFFLVSSVFKKEELALLLKLPVAQEGKGGEKKEQKPLTIELTNEKLAYNGSALSFDDLKEKLTSVAKSQFIHVRADEDLKYKRLVQLLDLLQLNRLENISLITEKTQKQ